MGNAVKTKLSGRSKSVSIVPCTQYIQSTTHVSFPPNPYLSYAFPAFPISALISSLIRVILPAPLNTSVLYTIATLAPAFSTSSACAPLVMPPVAKMTFGFGSEAEGDEGAADECGESGAEGFGDGFEEAESDGADVDSGS